MKILILKYRNIGDVLLTTPLLSNLRNFFQDAQIDFSVNKGTESMLTLNPNCNNVITYNRDEIKSLPAYKQIWHEFKFVYSFRKKGYDIVINLTNGDRGNHIVFFSKASIRIGSKSQKWLFKNIFSHHMPSQNFRHTIETNLDPLRVLNIPIVTKKVEIFWQTDDDNKVNTKLSSIDTFIHIHPVSRWLFKCISDDTMSAIIDYCEIKLGIRVVITASDNKFEIKKVEDILSNCKSAPINLSGELSLKQVAALNKRAKLFIGVDTSVMHISASNSVPVLAFFGPSGADHWGPWDNDLNKSEYSKRKGSQIMGRHRVISESRACQPCGKDGCNGSKVSDCLMNLNIKQIRSHIGEMLNG